MNARPIHVRRFARAMIEYVRDGGSVVAAIDSTHEDIEFTIHDRQLTNALIDAGEDFGRQPPATHDGTH